MSAPIPAPSTGKINFLNHIAFPALTAGTSALGVYNGDYSVGGAIGSAAGGTAGWALANKLLDKALPRWGGRIGTFGRNALKFVGGIAGGMAGSMAGQAAGDKFVPIYKREQPAF